MAGNSHRSPWGLHEVLLVLLMCSRVCIAGPVPTAAPPATAPGTQSVTSASQLLSAISDPTISTILVTKPFAMPHKGFAPAVVQRQLLITSPIRAMIDWCDKQCSTGNMSRTPMIIAGKVRQLVHALQPWLCSSPPSSWSQQLLWSQNQQAVSPYNVPVTCVYTYSSRCFFNSTCQAPNSSVQLCSLH